MKERLEEAASDLHQTRTRHAYVALIWNSNLLWIGCCRGYWAMTWALPVSLNPAVQGFWRPGYLSWCCWASCSPWPSPSTCGDAPLIPGGRTGLRPLWRQWCNGLLTSPRWTCAATHLLRADLVSGAKVENVWWVVSLSESWLQPCASIATRIIRKHLIGRNPRWPCCDTHAHRPYFVRIPRVYACGAPLWYHGVETH